MGIYDELSYFIIQFFKSPTQNTSINLQYKSSNFKHRQHNLFLFQPIAFINTYITTLSTTLTEQGYKISRIQRAQLAMLLSVILLCNRICWSDVELTTMGEMSAKKTWWIYSKSSLPWDALFSASIQMILKSLWNYRRRFSNR